MITTDKQSNSKFCPLQNIIEYCHKQVGCSGSGCMWWVFISEDEEKKNWQEATLNGGKGYCGIIKASSI